MRRNLSIVIEGSKEDKRLDVIYEIRDLRKRVTAKIDWINDDVHYQQRIREALDHYETWNLFWDLGLAVRDNKTNDNFLYGFEALLNKIIGDWKRDF